MADSLVLKESSSSPRSTLVPENIIRDICEMYESRDSPESYEWANSKALKDRVTSWCKRFADKYPPGTSLTALADSKQWDVEFWIFFLAYPTSGADLLRFVDACYAVDKAICGTSAAGQMEIEKWRDIDPFNYILMEDLTARWEADLCQLLDNIEHDKGNRLANFLRIKAISRATAEIGKVLSNNFADYAFTNMSEEAGWPYPFTLEKMTDTRQLILETSIKSLRISINQAEERWQTNTARSPNSGPSTSYQSPVGLNEGLRRRVPTIVTNNNDPGSNEIEESRNPVIMEVSMPYSSNALPTVSSKILSNLLFPSLLRSMKQSVVELLKPNHRRRTRNQILDFLAHKSTVLCMTLFLVVLSAALVTVSIIQAQQETFHTKEPLDSNFYSLVSQATLSLLTIYFTILPPLRSRSLNLRYKSWF